MVILGAVFCGSLVFYSVGRISIAIAAAIIAWCVSWYTKDLVAARTQRRGREGLAAFLGVVTADLRAGATLAGALARGGGGPPGGTPPGGDPPPARHGSPPTWINLSLIHI